MTEPAHSTEAVVLRTVDYRESDLIVHLLCRRLGRVSALARGARKSSRRFGGGLEPFALLQVEVQKRRGELLDFNSATIVGAHLPLRADLGSLAHAGYATEIVRELLHDHEPHDALLNLLLQFYATLCRIGPRSLTLRAFELQALTAAGFAPQLERCARCGDGFGTGPMSFDPGLGGVLCSRCSTRDSMPLDEAARRLLVALQQGGLAAAENASEDGLPMERIRRALRAFVDRHVHSRLHSPEFISSVGAPP